MESMLDNSMFAVKVNNHYIIVKPEEIVNKSVKVPGPLIPIFERGAYASVDHIPQIKIEEEKFTPTTLEPKPVELECVPDIPIDESLDSEEFKIKLEKNIIVENSNQVFIVDKSKSSYDAEGGGLFFEDGLRKFRCGLCGYLTDNKNSYITHSYRHTNEKKKCKFCDFATAYPYTLQTHEKMHTNNKPLQCRSCSFTSLSRYLLQAHQRKVHKKFVMRKCHVCSFTNHNRVTVIRHERKVHGFELVLKCEECGYKAHSEKALVTHKRIHSGVRCGVCKQVMGANREAQERHMSTHSLTKPFQCHLCSFTTTRKSYINNHMQAIHYDMGVKRFGCEVCGYSTNRESNVSRHMRKHTKEKPFKCDLCGGFFRQKCTLKSHIQTRHLGERKFECTQCDYRAGSRVALMNHLATHASVRPHPCPVCPYRATIKQTLKKHIIAHHTVFHCAYCIHQVFEKIKLVRHIQELHWNAKPPQHITNLTIVPAV